MQKTLISEQQATAALYLMFMSSILTQGVNPQAGGDSYISSVLAFVLSIPLLLMYARLVKLHPEKDLFQMLESTLGKFVGKILTIFYIFFGIVLSSMTLRGYVSYLTIEALPETPSYILYIALLIIVTAFALYRGIETRVRLLHVLSWVYSLFAYGILTLSLNVVKFENIKPVLYNGFEPVLNGAVDLLFFPYGTAILIFASFASLKPSAKVYRIFLKSAFFACIIITLTFLRNLLVLGSDSLQLYLFPSHQAISLISIGNFIERMEIVPSLINLLLDTTKLAIACFFVVNGLKRLFNVENYKTFIAPAALLIFNYSLLSKGFLPNVVEWDKMFKYFALPFELLLPLLLYIVSEIRSRVSKMLQNISEMPADEPAA